MKYWRRYVDDIVLVFTSRDQWESFKETCNDIFVDDVNAIKLTSVVQEDGKPVPVLDVELSIDEQGKVKWTHYRKKVASTQVIHFRSAHDLQTKMTFASSEVLRILRNCRDEEDAEPFIETFRHRLRAGEWPEAVINTQIAEGYRRRDGILAQVSRGERSLFRSREERAMIRERIRKENRRERARTNTMELCRMTLPFCADKSMLQRSKHTIKRSKLNIQVREGAGDIASNLLSVIDFKPLKCTGCAVCRAPEHPDLPKPRCNDRGIAYVIRHNADGVEYVGETSRQIGIRLAEHLKPVSEEQIRRFKENKKGEHTCSAVAAYCMEKHNGNFDVSIGLLSKGKNCAHRLALENNGIELRQAGMNRMHDGVNIG